MIKKICLLITTIILLNGCSQPTENSNENKNDLIVFNRDMGGRQLYIMDIDGNNLTPLFVSGDHNTMYSSFSSDGSKVVSESYNYTTGKSDIIIVNSDGTGFNNLTNGEGHNMHPSFSPDGEFVTFSSYGRAGQQSRDIYIMNISSGEITNLTNSEIVDSKPQFIATGSKILFIKDYTPYLINIDGSDEQIFQYNGLTANWATFSANCDKVLFQNNGQYYTYDDHSKQLNQIVLEEISRPYNFTISPSGNLIAFIEYGHWLDELNNLYIMNFNGSELKKIDSLIDGQIQITSDDKNIVYTSIKDYTPDFLPEIYVADLMNNTIKNLTNNSERETNLRVSGSTFITEFY